jgi:hypothetical protein
MTQQNLLPRFGSEKSTETPVPEGRVVETRAVETRAVEEAPDVAVFSSGAEAPSMPPAQDVPPLAPAAVEPCVVEIPAVSASKVRAFLKASKALHPFGSWARFKNPFARLWSKEPRTMPWQAELLLDSVKPVRNDLSEANIRADRQEAAPSAGIAVMISMPAGVSRGRGPMWQRLKTRWFGMGKPN